MTVNIPIISTALPGLCDNLPVAIYVHGLASGAAGTTINSLARKFKQYRWITTDFGENIETNVAMLNCLICQENPELIVGTSMGGLTVLYADAPNAIKVVCNPALSIADCVRHTIGLGKHNYFCERIDGLQSFELTNEMCCNYDNYIKTNTPLLGKENYAIFSAHDEVLGDEAAARAREIVSAAGYKVYNSPENQHRLSTATLEIIKLMISK